MDRLEETIFKWGGLAMIFVAVAFAMSIAIDHGLYSPPLRVASGVLVGLTLIAVGIMTYLGRPVFGQSLQGTGVAVIFLSVFAGHQMFDVMSFEGAIGATIAATAASFWLAARRGDSALAAIGLSGGLLAPFVLTLGDAESGVGGLGDPNSLDSYVIYATVLLLAAIAVYLVNGWGSLLATAGVLGVASFSWIAGHVDPMTDSRLVAQVGLTTVALVAWIGPVFRLLADRPVLASRHSVDLVWSRAFRGSEFGSVIWVPAAALVATTVIWDLPTATAGFLALATAVMVGLVGGFVRSGQPVLALTHFVSGFALLASAAMLLLEGPWLMLALGGQAFASIVVARRVSSPAMLLAGFVVATPVAMWAGLEASSAALGGVRLLPIQLAVHLVLIGFVAMAAAMDPDKRVRGMLAGVTYGMAIVWFAEAFIGYRNGPAVTTAAWVAMAGAASWLALRLDSAAVARTSLATVGVAVAKLLVSDLTLVNDVGRTVGFLAAGIVLVAFGYRYPALREVMQRDKARRADGSAVEEPLEKSIEFFA